MCSRPPLLWPYIVKPANPVLLIFRLIFNGIVVIAAPSTGSRHIYSCFSAEKRDLCGLCFSRCFLAKGAGLKCAWAPLFFQLETGMVKE